MSMNNIIKQGYLKKAHPTSPSSTGASFATSIKQLFEPQRWYVFGMKNGIPHLEYYDKEESAFSGEPIHSYCMANCKRITYTMGRLNKVWTFCIFLEDRILELTAESRDSMLAWCRILERTLHAFGNLRKTSSEHVYSAYPIRRPPKKSLPVTPPGSPQPQGAEAPPLPTSNHGTKEESDKEEIFESQRSLMNSLRNSEGVGLEIRRGRHRTNSDSSGSEPDTTGDEDFVAEDFFVNNKKLQKSPAVHRRFRDDLGIKKRPTPQPVRPLSMINYPPSQNIYENENLDFVLDPRLQDQFHGDVVRNKEIPPAQPLTKDNNYSFVRRQRLCSGDTSSKPETDGDNYELARNPFTEEFRIPERPPSDPYLDMCDADRSRTLTKPSSNVHQLDDGYQVIRSEDGESKLVDYEDMTADMKDLRVFLPPCDEKKRQSGLSDASTPTSKESGSVFLGSRDSSSKEDNLYAPFPVSLDSQGSTANVEDIPSVPPPRTSGTESPKCSSPDKPPRHKKGSSVVSPPHSNRNSRESDSPRVASPVPPPLDSIPSRKTPQDIPMPDNMPSSVLPLRFGEFVPGLSNFSRPDDPDKGNFYSVQPVPPKRRNVPPPTDYAYVTPKPEDKGLIPELPPPRRQPSNIPVGKGLNSPPQQSFKFKPGLSEPGLENHSDSNDEYEDATMMNGQPPRPPPRRSNLKNSKSYTSEEKTNVTRDDMPIRPKSSVVRQQSLQERQRISQTVGVINVVPLKQSQVELLQQEQRHPFINITINRAWGTKIGLVDCFDKVWVAGWDMKTCPRLSDKLHIGDQLLKINDKKVKNSADAQRMYKSGEETVVLTVHRLPYAQVIAIHRQENKQPIGIQREGGTSKIVYVDPNGLAAHHGLQQRARSVLVGSDFCYWCLTEINSRPLDLSFKGNEVGQSGEGLIDHLLNAVGRDISIVVQPEDFVKELKKQLKKLKNYKDLLMKY
ncbi:serine/arginine repetitive matrix protein 1-like isoform X3 [Saccostrea echinata]|uniref:serine/arginine repetitive matrix protein 1-like isoform X3 n=1 Tax=Saccostrea echinata TaxID=191078 RepID=UPI002A8378B5|nr:serine/arginine repetitive matrix protein 1-like isoform X3 [Saccostrea echinata]